MNFALKWTKWIIIGLVFALDRWCKYWFITHPDFIFNSGIIKISLSVNDGVAFGWFSGLPTRWILALNISIVSLFVLLFFQIRDPVERFGIELILIGAFGNFLDRLIYSYVVDYIHLRFFAPVFNLSDVLITVGAGVMFWREVGIRR